jgi:hypothetical protein
MNRNRTEHNGHPFCTLSKQKKRNRAVGTPLVLSLASSSEEVQERLRQLPTLSLLKLIEVTAFGAEEPIGLRYRATLSSS